VIEKSVLQWVLDSDPSIRWQVKWTRFTFPTLRHYDVLRGLDYLCRAGVKPDERMAEAVGLVDARRQPDGRWLLDEPHHDAIHDLEGGAGQPSRWNTLRALRVLDWYSAQQESRQASKAWAPWRS
jgi:hypothetical protein